MDAGDRRLWTTAQDTRPLSDLGRRQAGLICGALATESVDALFSSAALRSRQTIEPLAERFGLRIELLDGLHETGWAPPAAWLNWRDEIAIGGAYAAGRGMRALREIRATVPGGRVVAATHGDVLPAVVAYLDGAYDLGLPAPNSTRGGWYTIVLSGNAVEVHHHDVLPGFPL
jgi:broad specificity phosphatase PhoE